MGQTKLGRICVDFDETIVLRGTGLSIKSVVPHCKEALHLLKVKGYEIVVASCRTNKRFGGKEGKGHKDMFEFLKTNNIQHDHVDDGTKGKVVATFYVDDRGVGMPMKDGHVNWRKVYNIIIGE